MSGLDRPALDLAGSAHPLSSSDTSPGPTVYLVAPDSLASWFSHFVEHAPGNEIVFMGEGDLDVGVIASLLERQPTSTAVICSSHETLTRDCALGEALRRRGVRTVAPSATSARLGTDKVRMKQFFDRRGFASTPWACRDDVARLGSPDALVVVKRRHGTQSVGTRLARLDTCVLDADEFCELYVDGVEYSLVVYRDDDHELVFPPVWKGATSTALVPPWRRLRICPDPRLTPECERALRQTALAVARDADLHGHLEIEYLVTPSGKVLVLELNPRVAGTMRLAAMAARLPIFSLHRLPPLVADVGAVRCAAEVPYAGPAQSDPAREVFATSRLTAAGRTWAEARKKIEIALGEARRAERALARRERPRRAGVARVVAPDLAPAGSDRRHSR